MHWRDYHEATKHTREKLAGSTHTLDWANMPDPFRHYEGTPLLDLPADPPQPGAQVFHLLRGGHGVVRGSFVELLSSLFFFSAAISASKRVPSTGHRYALRVNPSSGNLHPTEFHLMTPSGLYHYRPSSHLLEVRSTYAYGGAARVLLTSIPWRETWKYQERGYRYCLLDIGHAAESVALAARALGLQVRVERNFHDPTVDGAFCLAEDEWPMLLLRVDGLPSADSDPSAHYIGGVPNALSPVVVPYPLTSAVHHSTQSKTRPKQAPPSRVRGRGDIQLGLRADTGTTLAAAARRRRSALGFLPSGPALSLAQLSTLLECAVRGAEFVHLYAFVHRVDGLDPGVYRYWQHSRTLERKRAGDQRVIAAALSLTQQLAGESCVTFSMVAGLERAAACHGARGYRYVHFEAGAIGQRLYLAAEAMGFHATGIGAFFDDEVHRYLEIEPDEGQVVYHFACGYAVPDPRLNA